MTKTADPNDDYLSEIIKLQLKKPKRWNWELTTSRSSPHITLPVIQLYNAKGRLLVEAKESGSERRSWHSNDWAKNDRSHVVQCIDPKPLQKCTSDILHRYRYGNNPLRKSSTIDLDKGKTPPGESPAGDKSIAGNGLNSLKYRQVKPETNVDDESLRREPKVNRNVNKYVKSKSAILLENGSKDKNPAGLDVRRNYNKYVRSKTNTVPSILKKEEDENLRNNRNKFLTKVVVDRPKCPMTQTKTASFNLPIKHGRANQTEDNPIIKSRSVLIKLPEDTKGNDKFIESCKKNRSDDLYKRLLKYNEESIKRAINDGYKKFLNVDINKSGKIPERMKKETVKVKTEAKPEVNRVKYSKYITRTCSAGTLVIKEESFSNSNLRRRRKTADSDQVDNTKVPNFSSLRRKELYPNKKNDITYPHMLTHINRNRSSERTDSLKLPAYNNLIHSKSDVSCATTGSKGCDYTVEEPSSLESRKNSEDIGVEKLDVNRRRRYRKIRGRSAGECVSISSGTCSDEYDSKGNSIKARVVKEHKKDAISDAELLRLVRGLSNDHVKMGANVSRHSSKGLSGRRTQSSGSICNGKGGSGGGGRHTNSEPKICGSLPSYLDERDATTGCNNNHHHDYEKPPLQDVERIPPLGDGAPLHWKFSDTQTALCDQGYGSERSPEEEYPPPLPEHDNQCHHHLDLHSCYPFITPESTFTVSLAKGSRGLGLSVTGGVDSGGSWPGLIRVKRLFPHQPAASCEMLNVGDLILEVNGITLTGLTNYEALEVLRTASNQVELKICRPPPDVLSCVSPISEVPPPPPRREPPSSLNLTSSSDDDHCLGEFEVTMRKLQGSLGFTLRKEDDSALGHYIRALVREPALTDSRIRAGDKIIAVNDVEISSMTHEEAVQFLRQSGEIVKLRLYRDLAQTPVATLSPTETTPRTSFSKKTQLRQEAVDMLNDIAVRKLIPGNQDIYGRRSQSPNTSPRRLRRQPCPSDASHISDSSNKYLITDEQFHEGLLKKCSLPLDEDSFNSLFIEDDDCDKPSRPSSLDLYNPNQTPVATRKPKFNFSLAHNAYELNNLDAEILDAPNLTYNLGPEDVNSTEVECGDSFPQEPASMPHIPTDNPGFSYKNPAYQSAHPQCGTENGDDKTPKAVIDDTNMKKWKGVVFTADEERERERQRSIKAKTPKNEEEDKYEILAIELNRGWNSRLGFSLQGAAGVTYVSAVHADSVAARDGRIKPGDCLIKVNDESVEHMSTTEIIDLLRIVRGPVCIVVSRPKPKEDCMRSSAAN